MTIIRLRPTHPPEVLASLYAQPHDHSIYGRGHAERVQKMIELGVDIGRRDGSVTSVADLSCGNGAVAQTVARLLGLDPSGVTLGDIATGWPFVGPLESTLEQLPDRVDLYVCGETLEHLDDPSSVLRSIRAKTRLLVLSTPTDNWGDTNAEHYWSWGEDDVQLMLETAGFAVDRYAVVDSREYGEPYRYGVWTWT